MGKIKDIILEPANIQTGSNFKLKIKTTNETQQQGSNLTFDNSKANQATIRPEGNCEQDGTPIPDNPIDVKVVTGDNQVVVCNANVLNNIVEIGSINNTYGNKIDSSNTLRTANYSLVVPNTEYTISNDKEYANYVYEYDINKTFIRSYSGNDYYNTHTFTTSPTTHYILVRGISNQTDTSVKWNLNVGNTVLPYVAHAEQSYTLHLGSLELCKIGDYQDVITGTKDNWKVVRKVGKDNQKQFTGGSVDSGTFYIQLNGRATTTDTNQVLYCDKLFFNGNYINLTNAKTYMTDYQIAVNNNGTSKNIFIKNSNYITEGSFREWLNSLNLTWYYQLATLIEETITDTTLIEQLNNLYNASSYDGITNISITSTHGAQMIVSASVEEGE